jgi:hypothetical protein
MRRLWQRFVRWWNDDPPEGYEAVWVELREGLWIRGVRKL